MAGRYVQFLLGVVLLTSMSVEAAACARSLFFEDGHSSWRVQVPEERTCPIDFAATELTNVIARISSAGCWSNAAFTDWLVERLDTVITKHNPDNAAKGSGLASSGWPVAAHGDFGLAATLEFSHE